MDAPSRRARRPWPLGLTLLLAALWALRSSRPVHRLVGSGAWRLQLASTPPPPAACRHWATAEPLPGGCLGSMPPGLPFRCCSGRNYTCSDCSFEVLRDLGCFSQRHMLLRPPAGGGASASSGAGAAGGSSDSSSSDESSSDSGGGDAAGGPSCAPPGGLRLLGAAEVAPRCLWAAGFDRVLISGDSSVRHLFNRLVSLLRQQGATLDGGGMQHAHYAQQLWRSGSGGGAGSSSSGGGEGGGGGQGSYFATDELWYSPSANAVPGTHDTTQMAAGLQHLLRLSSAAAAQQAAAAAAAGGGGGAGIIAGLIVDFLIGSTSAWQQWHVRQYAASQLGGDGGRRTLLLLSLCFWEDTAVWPAGWRQFVSEMQQRVGQLVLLTCPTDRLTLPAKAGHLRVAHTRNQQLRAMVAEGRGGTAPPPANGTASGGGGGAGAGQGAAPLMLLDIDALTRRLPAELTIGPQDYHYACHLGSNSRYQRGAVEWSGGDGSPRPAYPQVRYDHLRTPASGRCADPIGYAAWQLLFAHLC